MLNKILKEDKKYLLNNKVGNIYQLSNDPDVVTDGDIKYIGYEHIGKYYSGESKVLSKHDIEKCEFISKYIGDGFLLDLACGDGLYTVPLSFYNINIVAGDISNKMLSILEYRAKINKINLDTVELCRINALDLPFEDESFDFVIGNSFLHLISKPEIAIKEIYRVLKKGGKFLCFEDLPGQEHKMVNITEDEENKNKEHDKVLYEFENRYWSIIKGEYSLKQSMYSWKFNRDEACMKLFNTKEEILIECNSYKEKIDLWESYLYRTSGKGFSSQSYIPDEIHKKVFNQVMDEFINKYGEEFYKNYTFTYAISGIDKMIVYIK